jgi:hypothetical protein
MTDPYRTPDQREIRPSKIIQIAGVGHYLVVLDEDGRLWQSSLQKVSETVQPQYQFHPLHLIEGL